ncbi:MAG TPA: alpha/beta hydrolase [Anaerolineae bacterium]
MFFDIKGLKVYYEVVGSGRPVLLLHGWGVDSQSMRPIAHYVNTPLGARAYALDFPGFGLSDTPQAAWAVDDYVQVVVELLDQLQLDTVDLIAHSFGGRVAIKLAAQTPQRVNRMVLVGCAGIRPDRTAGYYVKVTAAKATRRLTRLLPGPLGERVRATILSRLGSRDYRSAGKLRGTFVKVINEDLRHVLPHIQAPVLLVWGDSDTETPLKDGHLMAELIPQARLVVLPKTGHYCYLDDFPAFSRALLSFLDPVLTRDS